MFIVVHGTWALDSSWYQPGGDFFEELRKSASLLGASIISFTWSGKNLHESRVHAAQKLSSLMQSYPPDYEINLVTHSHGSNVGILASQFLGKKLFNNHSINSFYALGTPIDTTAYMPDMHVIHHFYNLFSFADLIQPVLGMFARQLPTHERIANVRVIINGTQPSHTQLHSPLIARWLPFLDHIPNMQDDAIIFKNPGILHFYDEQQPLFLIDHDRQKLLDQDHRISLMLAGIVMDERSKILH